MSRTPFEQAGSLEIGTVEFVSPDEIKIAIDIEAPDSMALNTGRPRPFPRVNEYLLIPVDQGFLVGQVEWITVERSPFPKRKGMQDFGLIDLPYPLRRLSLNPLGILRAVSPGENFEFRRGCDVLPSVGIPAILPTDEQLKAIVESGQKKRVCIGTSPVANNAKVYVDPDRLFGRHLAVLGNTGSGKSCSVAGLIRWCIEEVQNAEQKKAPNARFIVLDPNGEYSRAFSKDGDKIKARIFRINPADGESPLKVPLWFWNSAEWCAFSQASAKTQRPALMHALRYVREGISEASPDASIEMRKYLRTILTTIRIEQNNGTPWGSFPKPKSFFEKIEKWKSGLESKLDSFQNKQYNELQDLINEINKLCVDRKSDHPNYDFTLQEIESLLEKASKAHSAFGGSPSDLLPSDVDIPKPFDGTSLLRCLESVGEVLNISEHIETLLIRIRSLLEDKKMKQLFVDDCNINLQKWLKDYIGNNEDGNLLSIIDLSLVPTDVVHIVTAVIARMIFEALQRYVKLNHIALPTVLVMEEAHTFIKHYKEDAENQDAAAVCCQVFERIAREGRKFGLGLVLSSQRPSELSPTVLSQCNTFLLHRISNDRDQEIVNRLVPDNLRGLLRELPSLPSQHAVLLGWASELPVLVKMNDLPKSQQPRSDDPDFWNVWTGKDEEDNPVERKTNWQDIADDWQQKTSSDTSTEKKEYKDGENGK